MPDIIDSNAAVKIQSWWRGQTWRRLHTKPTLATPSRVLTMISGNDPLIKFTQTISKYFVLGTRQACRHAI